MRIFDEREGVIKGDYFSINLEMLLHFLARDEQHLWRLPIGTLFFRGKNIITLGFEAADHLCRRFGFAFDLCQNIVKLLLCEMAVPAHHMLQGNSRN